MINMEKPIVFKNKNGKQLVGMLHLPKGKGKPRTRTSSVRGRFPAVIICHGFGGTKTGRKFIRLARALAENKIASFRFDFEGCGDSEGDLEKLTVKNEVADLKYAMEEILNQKFINKNKIALLGHSLGALIISLFVVQNKFPVKTLVFWAPAFNQSKIIPYLKPDQIIERWKKQKYIINQEDKIGLAYLKENEKKDYSSIFSEVNVSSLIIHGKKDETVPLLFSQELAKQYKNIKLTIFPKADHKFEDYYIQKDLIQKTVAWLKERL